MSDKTAAEYPECEKLASFRDERSTLSDFFEWLNNRGMFLCQYEEGSQRPWPVSASDNTLIMQFLEIDEVKLEQERRDMLVRAQCDHLIDMYAPRCAEIDCPNYAGRYAR